MRVVIDIPNSVIPLEQYVINLDLHFIDGHICECTFPFKELPKGHGRLIEELEKKLYEYIDPFEVPGALEACYDTMEAFYDAMDRFTKGE